MPIDAKDVEVHFGGHTFVPPDKLSESVATEGLGRRAVDLLRDLNRFAVDEGLFGLPRPRVERIEERIEFAWFGPMDGRTLTLSIGGEPAELTAVEAIRNEYDVHESPDEKQVRKLLSWVAGV